MKKVTRFLFLGAIAFFLLVGPAIATPVTYDFFYPPNDTLWARLTANAPTYDVGANLYSYSYTLQNLGSTGQSIHMLDIQIGTTDNLTFNLGASVGEPMLIGIQYKADNFVRIVFQALVPGEISPIFGFTTDLAPGEGWATVHNSSQTDTDYCVATALVSYDGGAGSDPVPEPSTLLLIGSGLLGMAGAKGFRRSRKN
jgi:hypothetical protein